MWGSDVPVCRLRAEYDVLQDAAQTLTSNLSDLARTRIFGETATAF